MLHRWYFPYGRIRRGCLGMMAGVICRDDMHSLQSKNPCPNRCKLPPKYTFFTNYLIERYLDSMHGIPLSAQILAINLKLIGPSYCVSVQQPIITQKYTRYLWQDPNLLWWSVALATIEMTLLTFKLMNMKMYVIHHVITIYTTSCIFTAKTSIILTHGRLLTGYFWQQDGIKCSSFLRVWLGYLFGASLNKTGVWTKTFSRIKTFRYRAHFGFGPA